ncbi:hypothetical protein BH20VER1_BH20VER1_03170 [soil metagenome]
MKALLGCLLCLVFTSAQCFALKGGPPYPAGTNVVGTYAGVLEPRFDPTDPFSSNSLGVFSLSVPGTGLATGTFVMFSRGMVFRGTIEGLGDPTRGSVTGVLDAAFTITNRSTTDIFGFVFPSSTTSVTARAQGNLNATVSATRSGLATAATLLKGTANLFISQTNTPGASPSPGTSPVPTPIPTPTPPGGGSGGTGGVTAAFTLDVMGFKQSNTATAAGTGIGLGTP